jgi:anti-sigma regulatory factor (Ser/Thr protein kinase)
MTSPRAAEPVVLQVGSETDRYWCAGEVRRFARDVGFPDRAQWELAIVAAELVSNAVRYAGSGTLTLSAAPGPRAGMVVAVADPGADAARETRARPGLGLGLRTVLCLCHDVAIERAPAGGTVVTVARYLEP